MAPEIVNTYNQRWHGQNNRIGMAPADPDGGCRAAGADDARAKHDQCQRDASQGPPCQDQAVDVARFSFLEGVLGCYVFADQCH